MKHLVFWLDFISPYAHLAFDRLPRELQGLSYQVSYRPILFAALLKHHGQLGPAEIAPKRDWTYRQVLWQAHAQGTPTRLPAAHPFNPLPLLRLALAAGQRHAQGQPNRFQCERAFAVAWNSGMDPSDLANLAPLGAELGLSEADMAPDSAVMQHAKSTLKANTDAALAAGVFGVPTVTVDGRHFWGNDALPMLAAYLRADPWFEGPSWTAAANLPTGISRRP
jgi:2-hydroxychromene-2-carboxylate isomerase